MLAALVGAAVEVLLLLVLAAGLILGGGVELQGQAACAPAAGSALVGQGEVPFGQGDAGDPTRGYPTGPVDSGLVLPGGEGGTWGGAMPRALDWATLSGITPSSQKRSRMRTASGGISDHWVGSSVAYGVDLPTRPLAGDAIAERLAGAIGIAGYRGGSWQSRTIGGFRYQIGWRIAGHFDHIHIGVRRVAPAADPDGEGTPIPVAAPQPAAAPAPLSGSGDAAGIDAYLAAKSSPLAGLGEAFVASGARHGVDPRFLVAISGAETSFAAYPPAQAIRNPFGLGPHIVYGSYAEAIEAAARNLAGDLYRGEGRFTLVAIWKRWAPVGAANDPAGLNSNWPRNVSRYFAELGGDPAAPVLAETAGAPVGQGVAAVECAPGQALDAAPAGELAQAVVDYARRFVGDPYLWGANHVGYQAMLTSEPQRRWDCSSLLSWAYARGARIDIGGVTYEQWARGRSAPGASRGTGGPPPGGWRAGDLLFRRPEARGPGHVAMAIDATQMIHAPRSGEAVRIEPIPAATTLVGWVRYAQLAGDAAADEVIAAAPRQRPPEGRG